MSEYTDFLNDMWTQVNREYQEEKAKIPAINPKIMCCIDEKMVMSNELKITGFDYFVYSVIYSFVKIGRTIFSTDEIADVLFPNSKNAYKVNMIFESMEKLSHIRATTTDSASFLIPWVARYYQKRKKPVSCKVDLNLFESSCLSGGDTHFFLGCSGVDSPCPLLSISEKMGNIMTIPATIFETSQEKNWLYWEVLRYLVKRIGKIRAAGQPDFTKITYSEIANGIGVDKGSNEYKDLVKIAFDVYWSLTIAVRNCRDFVREE